MKKATAVSPANIAFIKYWGKKDAMLKTPLTDSLSMTIDAALTTTTVEFDPLLKSDQIEFVDEKTSQKEIEKISEHLDRIRLIAKSHMYAKVMTKNSFPKGTGAASSASGFAALSVAAAEALGLSVSQKELSILARLGSGSACRSIPDGFVRWYHGHDSDSSFASSLFPHTHWNLRDMLLIVSNESKKIGSTQGMSGIHTSPFYQARVSGIPALLDDAISAIEKKDIVRLGEIIEKETINMHAVMMTQNPPIFYWNEITLRIMMALRTARETTGLQAYFTIDAGPNVHIIYEANEEEKVQKLVNAIDGIKGIEINKPARGAHSIDTHLF